MTRNGKIARLPDEIRNQLNQRLRDGEEAAPLLTWLNGLPEIQEVLKDIFEGAPITKQNLSEWRQGGFREWQIREELIDHAVQLSESVKEMDQYADASLLAGQMAAFLAARYAALLNSWDGEPDPKFEEKLRVLRGLNRDVALLQKTLAQAHRQKREQEEAENEKDRQELEMEKKRVTDPIWAKLEAEAIAEQFGNSPRGQYIAEVLSRTKYNLPPPKNWEAKLQQMKESLKAKPKSRPRRKNKSEPFQANPSESNQNEPGEMPGAASPAWENAGREDEMS